MRKTKIIATLGPASNTEEIIRELILAGVNVLRFNFSHGDYEEHLSRLRIVEKLREEMNMPIATLLDTKGPEVRLGKFEGGRAILQAGETFTLTAEDVIGTSARASVSYNKLPEDVKPGNCILLDDGLIELEVLSVQGSEILTRVKNGGVISDRKGVNIPGVFLSMPYLNKKDEEDIVFGIQHGFDIIAASFVRCADDVLQIRKILDKHGNDTIRIIAKIENADGVNNSEEIIRVSDGIMVARGDMGVEIPLEEVPVLQKKLIRKGYLAGKQVITATQMLDSMMTHPRPTRAESTDVANAIYDGTSAIMLSGETAAGKYPVEAVTTMARIARRAERDIDYKKRFFTNAARETDDVTGAISHATCTTAYDLNAAAIITITKSGQTARMVSRYRPDMPIIGCAMDDKVLRQMNLSWGVSPVKLEEQTSTDALFTHAVEEVSKAGLVKNGDVVVITAGIPLGMSGTTNMIKVHIVGDVLVKGKGINNLCSCANLCVAKN
ncbi:MAG: pyruvate kinase, partial [Christensenellaceae bacterium]|nr:pyruvate kinase [Christensenellaceae bacterium]